MLLPSLFGVYIPFPCRKYTVFRSMVVVVFGCKGRCAEFSRQRGSTADLRSGMSVIRARNSELVGFSQKINVGAVNDRPYEKNLEIGNLAGLELKLQFVSNQCDEFRIGGNSIDTLNILWYPV